MLSAALGISNVFFLWHKSGASLVALRSREYVRHAAASRPWMALALASLWLLLACDLLPEAIVCVWCFYEFFCSENCVSVYFFENISRVCFVVPSCRFLVVFVVENPTTAT